MSKIKFLKITTNYNSYINSFVVKNPTILQQNYTNALNDYLNDGYGWANFWKLNLDATGIYECYEIIENAEFLQKKWANENGVVFTTENWKKEIVIEQIKQIKPDVLFIVDQYNDNSLAKNIKKVVPSIKLILGWDGILWHKPETYEYTDIILSCVPDTVTFYSTYKKLSYYHKFGFEETILKKLTKKTITSDVSFAGSLVLSENYHLNRLKLVAEINRKTDMEIYASSLPSNWNFFSKSRLIDTLRNNKFKFAYDLHCVGKKNRAEVFGLDMFNVLYNSKIVFNTHGDNSIKTAANMRLTEATGVGALLLTDWKENINDIFVPDEEVVTYKTVNEAIDKIKMLLNDEKLRQKIASNGQKRTLKDYSYKIRMNEFSVFLQKYI